MWVLVRSVKKGCSRYYISAERGLPFRGPSVAFGNPSNITYFGFLNQSASLINPQKHTSKNTGMQEKDSLLTFLIGSVQEIIELIFTSALDALKEMGINFDICRGQCNDNGSNMSGCY